MSLGWITIIFLLAALVGSLPTWKYSRNWGYGPSSFFGVALLVILFILAGRP